MYNSKTNAQHIQSQYTATARRRGLSPRRVFPARRNATNETNAEVTLMQQVQCHQGCSAGSSCTARRDEDDSCKVPDARAQRVETKVDWGELSSSQPAKTGGRQRVGRFPVLCLLSEKVAVWFRWTRRASNVVVVVGKCAAGGGAGDGGRMELPDRDPGNGRMAALETNLLRLKEATFLAPLMKATLWKVPRGRSASWSVTDKGQVSRSGR